MIKKAAVINDGNNRSTFGNGRSALPYAYGCAYKSDGI